MKLSDLRSLKEDRNSTDTMEFKDCDIWLDVGSKSDLEPADVSVEFEYEPPSHTDHPYGEGSAREYHSSSVEILAVRLVNDTNRISEDGEVIGTLTAGTDITEQPWWNHDWEDWFTTDIREKMDREHSGRRRR